MKHINYNTQHELHYTTEYDIAICNIEITISAHFD